MVLKSSVQRRIHLAAPACFTLLVFLLAATSRADQPEPIAQSGATSTHVFRYIPPAGQSPQHVFLAGEFNNWSTSDTPMSRADGGFEASLPLEDGVHYYKFVVDGKWTNDPQSEKDLEVDDDNGGKNSAVTIGLDASKLPAPKSDTIVAAAIAFNPADVRDCNVASDQLLRLSLRVQSNGVTEAAVLTQNADQNWHRTSMWKATTGRGFDRYGTLITAASSPLHYFFELKNGTATRYIAGKNAYPSQDDAASVAYSADMTPAFDTPDWAKHAVWYQIFPERFRNGDPSNDPANSKKWTSAWFSKLPGETGKFYNDVWNRRYGGDIQGIQAELPYLRQLGVTAIYLNPIFQAESVHKYDTTDYRHVDEHFGYSGDIEQIHGETDDPSTWQWTRSDKLFLDFVSEAHRQGFRVIIDGVFNHVGRPFWAFQDIVKHGKNSKYAGWFDITDWTPSATLPFHYNAWDGKDGALPAFKKDAKLGIVHGPREHIFAIAHRWLAPDGDAARGVDGFRLDAPENVPHPFWVDFRKEVKSIKPDAYIDGEIWSWAQSYLQGNQFDAVMNYQFAIPAQAFFVNNAKAISVQEFSNRLNALIYNYPFQVSLVNQNLFDSHDTDRAASMFVNPDLNYDATNRIQDNGPKYNPRKPNETERLRMLQEVACQMTFVGAPMIYYGDEAGMWGPDDPSDRQPMIWKDLGNYDDPQVQFDQAKFDWYQRLIAIRRQLPALQTGFFHTINTITTPNVFAYVRDLGDQHVYVVLNRSAKSRTVNLTVEGDETGKFTDWLSAGQLKSNMDKPDSRPEITSTDSRLSTNDHGSVEIRMAPWSTRILTRQN